MKKMFVLLMLLPACIMAQQQEVIDYKGNLFESYAIWVGSNGATQPINEAGTRVYNFTVTSTCPIVSLAFCDVNMAIITDFSIETDVLGDVYVDSSTAMIVPEPGISSARIKAEDEWSPKGRIAYSDRRFGIVYGKLKGGLSGNTTCYVKITGIRKK